MDMGIKDVYCEIAKIERRKEIRFGSESVYWAYQCSYVDEGHCHRR